MDAAGSPKKKKRVKKSTSSFSSLPEELVEDILSRLPAKSLRRLQCVSRSFNATIASRAFQDAHYDRRKNDDDIGNNRRLFIRPPGLVEPFVDYAWQPGGRRRGVVEKLTTSSHRMITQGSVFPISKSCRGLVLLRRLEDQTHTVWNPSTGEAMALPDRAPPLGASEYLFTCCPLVSYGLGYCSATRRHKVVRMYCCVRGRCHPAAVCEVLVLNESTYWRPVDTGTLRHLPRENWRQGAVFCNGKLHFLRHGGDITTFDVTDETFGLLKRPPAAGPRNDFELTELGGNLCAYTSTEYRDWAFDENPSFKLWRLLRSDSSGTIWEETHCFDRRTLLQQLPHNKQQGINSRSSWIAPLDVGVVVDSGSISGRQTNKVIIFGTGSCHAFTLNPSDGAVEILFSLQDDDNDDVDDTTATTAIVSSGGSGRSRRRNDRLPTMGFFEDSLARVNMNDASNKKTISSSSPSMQAWSEVLSRLPARTLGRLQQVCRGWRGLIKTDESFLALHVRRANDLLLHRRSPHQMMMFVDGATYGFEDAQYFIDRPDATPPLIRDRLRVVCSSPCHGLNTLSFGNYDFVCNPITGYSKVLPLDGSSMDKKGHHRLLNQAITEASSANYYNNGEELFFAGRLGLGYELRTRRHVLVRLAYKQQERDSATTTTTTRRVVYKQQQLVCKIRYVDDMFWDDIDPPPRPVANDVPPAYSNGKLYWMAAADTAADCIRTTTPSSSPCHEIIVLDISTREFGVFPGPPCCNNNDGERVSFINIIELNERVCVACLHHNTRTMEIWQVITADDDDFLCWSVRYRIDAARLISPEYLPELATPLALDPKDGRILLSTGRALGYYDPKTTELQMIFHLREHVLKQDKKFVPILFAESLVHPRDPIFSLKPYEESCVYAML